MDEKAKLYKNAYEMEMQKSKEVLDILNMAMKNIALLRVHSETEIERLFMESDALDDELME